MNISTRIKYAYKAFINPISMMESEALKRDVQQMLRHDDIALIEGQFIGDYQTYKITMISPRDQFAVKRYLSR